MSDAEPILRPVMDNSSNCVGYVYKAGRDYVAYDAADHAVGHYRTGEEAAAALLERAGLGKGEAD